MSTAIGLRPPIRSITPFLQKSQQLDLQGQGNVSNLVEEKGPALRLLDLTLCRFDRAGESASLIAEEFGFEQVFRNGGAVDRDEGALCPRRFLVDCAGEQFLARSAGA